MAEIRPKYYGGVDNPYEAIKVIEAWELNFSLGNTVKYISRAGKKNRKKHLEDLQKASTYLQFEIDRLEREEKIKSESRIARKDQKVIRGLIKHMEGEKK
jgi:hypothetical protein